MENVFRVYGLTNRTPSAKSGAFPTEFALSVRLPLRYRLIFIRFDTRNESESESETTLKLEL